MTYRSLLVFLDQDPLCVARTQVAFQLAKALDCHLVGVAPTGLVDLPAVPEAEPSLMGAYGHARWIERLLGGATRGVLATNTLPVLMSH